MRSQRKKGTNGLTFFVCDMYMVGSKILEWNENGGCKIYNMGKSLSALPSGTCMYIGSKTDQNHSFKKGCTFEYSCKVTL